MKGSTTFEVYGDPSQSGMTMLSRSTRQVTDYFSPLMQKQLVLLEPTPIEHRDNVLDAEYVERFATVEEFEQRYAERSRVTVEVLHEHGRYGKPCDCGEELCEGWQMAHAEDDEMSLPSRSELS